MWTLFKHDHIPEHSMSAFEIAKVLVEEISSDTLNEEHFSHLIDLLIHFYHVLLNEHIKSEKTIKSKKENVIEADSLEKNFFQRLQNEIARYTEEFWGSQENLILNKKLNLIFSNQFLLAEAVQTVATDDKLVDDSELRFAIGELMVANNIFQGLLNRIIIAPEETDDRSRMLEGKFHNLYSSMDDISSNASFSLAEIWKPEVRSAETFSRFGSLSQNAIGYIFIVCQGDISNRKIIADILKECNSYKEKLISAEKLVFTINNKKTIQQQIHAIENMEKLLLNTNYSTTQRLKMFSNQLKTEKTTTFNDSKRKVTDRNGWNKFLEILEKIFCRINHSTSKAFVKKIEAASKDPIELPLPQHEILL